MVVYVVIGVAVLIFLCGIIFLLKGFREQQELKNAVPISSIQGSATASSFKEFSMPPQRPGVLADKIIQDNLKASKGTPPAAISAQEDGQRVKDLERQVSDLKQDNEELTQALKREMNSRILAAQTKEANEQLIKEKEMFEQAQKAVSALTEEKHALSKRLEEYKIKLAEGDDVLSKERAQAVERQTVLAQEVTALKEQLTQLENDHKNLRSEQEQASQYKSQLEQAENRLREQSEHTKASQEKLERLQGELAEQNAALKEEVRQVTEHNRELQGVRDNLEQKLIHTQQRWDSLSEEDVLSGQASDAPDVLFAKMKVLYNQLREKERLMQYELTKSRAQTLGLEKICAHFKLQIEEMRRGAAQV